MAEMKGMRSSQAGLCRHAEKRESRADDEALAAPSVQWDKPTSVAQSCECVLEQCQRVEWIDEESAQQHTSEELG